MDKRQGDGRRRCRAHDNKFHQITSKQQKVVPRLFFASLLSSQTPSTTFTLAIIFILHHFYEPSIRFSEIPSIISD